jgi:hypothetical protein
MIKTITTDGEIILSNSTITGYLVLDYEYEIDRALKGLVEVSDEFKIISCQQGGRFYTSRGYIIFKTLEDARHNQLRLRNPNLGYSKILEVSIPIGTKYCENNINYCTERICA